VTRITKTTKRIFQLTLAVWAVCIPLLEMPDAVPDIIIDACRQTAEARHAPHACEQSCATSCATTPPDVCCGTSTGGCGERPSRDCPSPRTCSRCLTAGDHLVFVNPGCFDFDFALADPLIPPPDQAAPVNLFKPPVPPPQSA